MAFPFFVLLSIASTYTLVELIGCDRKGRKMTLRKQSKKVILLSKNKVFLILAIFITSFFSMFILVGMMTSLDPSYRVASHTVKKWTSEVSELHYLTLMAGENRLFEEALPEGEEPIDIGRVLFELGTNVRVHDVRSLLGRELPGFNFYDREILIAGEGTDFTNLTVESTPPLEIVLEEREATIPEELEEEKKPTPTPDSTKKAVYIYNTHNRESFLPYLPNTDEPNDAFHKDINITRVSEQLAKDLANFGIGSQVEKADIGSMLVERDWNYSRDSYKASKEVVTAALAENQDIQYVFDLHRDSVRKDITTKEINGKNYARLMFVIGGDNPNFEANFALANRLHHALEEKFPGLSRGVEKYGGEGRNGVYNQDVSNNALLIEFGGVDNTFEELNNTSAVFAEIFSDIYFEAEKVSKEEGQ